MREFKVLEEVERVGESPGVQVLVEARLMEVVLGTYPGPCPGAAQIAPPTDPALASGAGRCVDGSRHPALSSAQRRLLCYGNQQGHPCTGTTQTA